MKLNFQDIANKTVGVAAGTAAAGFANRMLNQILPTQSPIIKGGLLIVLGAVGPGLISKKKGGVAEYAGMGIIAKGVDTVLRQVAPAMVAGPADDIAVYGVDDDYAEEEIVSGYADDLYEGTVTGIGSEANVM